MATTMAPEVIADPIGVVVDLVAERETRLDRTDIEAAVASVAGGRAKRRRLAQALLDRPEVLVDGRSPAPRAVADLLIAARKAGVAGISLPVSSVIATFLGEVLIHGYDIAQASRQPWLIPPTHAGLVFSGALPMLEPPRVSYPFPILGRMARCQAGATTGRFGPRLSDWFVITWVTTRPSGRRSRPCPAGWG